MSDLLCTRCGQVPSTGTMLALCDPCLAAIQAAQARGENMDGDLVRAYDAQNAHDGTPVVRAHDGRFLGLRLAEPGKARP